MPSAFLKNDKGEDYVIADPSSDLDYSLSCWIEGVVFIAGTVWEITPSGVATLYNPTINVSPITLNGVTYGIGKLATVWIKDLELGKDYKVTLKGLFTGNRKDDRSFIIQCRQR